MAHRRPATKTTKLMNVREMPNSRNRTSNRTSTKDLRAVIVKSVSEEVHRAVKIVSPMVRPNVSHPRRAKDHARPPTTDTSVVVRLTTALRNNEGDLHHTGATLHLSGVNRLLLSRVFLRAGVTLPRWILAMKFKRRSSDRRDDKKRKGEGKNDERDTQNAKKPREENKMRDEEESKSLLL